MNRLSSNWTLFWKIFIPIFYLAIFGSLALMLLVLGLEDLGPLGLPDFKLIYYSLFFSMLTLFWFTIIKINRVEIEEDQLFVTNYFKSIRVDTKAIIQVSRINLLVFNLITVKLSTKTRFGRKIYFLEEPVAKEYITGLIESHQH